MRLAHFSLRGRVFLVVIYRRFVIALNITLKVHTRSGEGAEEPA